MSAAAAQPQLVKSWFCVFLLVPMYIGTTFECFYMSNSQFGHILSCGPGPRPTYPGNYPVGARTLDVGESLVHATSLRGLTHAIMFGS